MEVVFEKCILEEHSRTIERKVSSRIGCKRCFENGELSFQCEKRRFHFQSVLQFLSLQVISSFYSKDVL